MKFKQLFEASQRGKLYHFTSFRNAEFICLNDELLGTDKNSEDFENDKNPIRISFTRNINFHKSFRGGIPIIVRFELDGNKLSENNKIIPFSYYGKSSLDNENGKIFREKYIQSEYSIQKFDENEEYIPIEKIKNLHKYIISITFTKNISGIISMEKSIKQIEKYCKDYKIRLIKLEN